MSFFKSFSFASEFDDDVRAQVGALCYRFVKDRIEVLMITSRGTARWVIPKGWPMKGKTPVDAAAQEAFEEAGVRGKPRDVCIGVYGYTKVMEKGDDFPCAVAVFPLKVTKLLQDFPESHERRRKWMTLKKAAARVAEPELKALLLSLNRRILRG